MWDVRPRSAKKTASSLQSANVQWCRSVVKSGDQGQSGQAVKLLDYTLRQWFPNTQQSRFPTACRHSFAFRFLRTSFIPDDVKLAELSNNSFEWKNVKFFFFWGGGDKTYSDPPTYFQRVKTPSPRIYAPEFCRVERVKNESLKIPIYG